MKKGTVFDIRRFTIHDGPGIRTTVFLKGCPLDCPWCHNPEGRAINLDLWHFRNKCIGCGMCIEKCPEKALSTRIDGVSDILIDYNKCTKCGMCVQECPTEALAFDGRIITSGEVLEEVMKDMEFYSQSGGGVTLSGGDPLCQSEFSIEILKACKEKSINTAVETCLFAEKSVLEKFVDLVDYFIVDLKIFDSILHKNTVGVENDKIRDNLKFLAMKAHNILVRIPLIPGFTANNENLGNIAAFVYNIRKDIPIELINYNPLAVSKYELMNRGYCIEKSVKPFSSEEIQRFEKMVEEKGVKCEKITN